MTQPARRARHHDGMDETRELLTEDEVNNLLDGDDRDAGGEDDEYEWMR
ncbi:hypothetical protein GCM10010381_57770 [Streptomyces xantholiticus]|nr:hypothetical protein GCM10010381_57770 [Streptomyces xantholiticus]